MQYIAGLPLASIGIMGHFISLICTIIKKFSALRDSSLDFLEVISLGLGIDKNTSAPVSNLPFYRVFSHDVLAAILVSQNNETAAMLVSQTSPVGIELFSYANVFFCSNKFA